jgi:hypothetical protein
VENSLLGIDCRYKPSYFRKNDTYWINADWTLIYDGTPDRAAWRQAVQPRC